MGLKCVYLFCVFQSLLGQLKSGLKDCLEPTETLEEIEEKKEKNPGARVRAILRLLTELLFAGVLEVTNEIFFHYKFTNL